MYKKVWMKSSINMNTELTINIKNDSQKHFFKLISNLNNTVFGKIIEHVSKHRDIKL